MSTGICSSAGRNVHSLRRATGTLGGHVLGFLREQGGLFLREHEEHTACLYSDMKYVYIHAACEVGDSAE